MALKQKTILEKLAKHIDKSRPIRSLQIADGEKAVIDSLFLLTAKPLLYIANVEESGVEDNPWLDKLVQLAHSEGSRVIPVCAAIESEIAHLDNHERADFLSEIGLSEPGLNRVINAGYESLGLHTFFTTGSKEARAWTIKVGDVALQAAGKVHTDIEQGFIRAEVISYKDYIKSQGEAGAKVAGKWRLEGKDYIVQDGDVILFRFNV